MSYTHLNPFSSGPTNRRRHVAHRRFARRSSVAIVGAALISTGACGAEPAPNATNADAAAATTSVTTLTTTSPTTSSTTVASATTTTPTATMPPRPTYTRDEVVGVDGVRLHVRCTGSGDTTVVLIAGFESGDETWDMIEPEIAARARVCSYARPGTGSSDPAGPTQTFTTQATQLNALLTTIGEPGPYVVVGHSFGGAEAITYASRYPDRVFGLVLIDASPASWPTELCKIADGDSDFAVRVSSTCSGWRDPKRNVEHVNVFASFEEVAGVSSLGSLPIMVITAVDRQFSGATPDELARLTEAWNQGQQRWSELSSVSQVIPVEDTSHDIQNDQPDVVVDAVIGLLP